MAKTLVVLGNNTFNGNIFKTADSLFGEIKDELFVGMVMQRNFQREKVSSHHEGSTSEKSSHMEMMSEIDPQNPEILSDFETKATSKGLKYKFIHEVEVSSNELIVQSIYADLLIMSYEVFFNSESQEPDTTFIYQLLKACKCPVLILPTTTNKIQNVIFTYDGKESSVFAIRMFSNLFSDTMRDKEITVLTVTPSADEEIKNEKLLLELIKQHHSNVGVQLMEGTNISEEIISYAKNVEDPLIVMGAYGRSHISNLFIPSVARNILKTSRFPIFIAHK